MNKLILKSTTSIIILVVLSMATLAEPVPVNEFPAKASPDAKSLFETYSRQGVQFFSSARGNKLWAKEVGGKSPVTTRSCKSCHGNDLKLAGKHIRTNKLIKPMAISETPSRFSKAKKTEKWFKRNCKWTYGRVCTPQEKADILSYLLTL